MTRFMFSIVLCATVSAGCGESAETVTGPTEVTLATQLFQGSLAAGGMRFFSFTVTQGGSVSFTLASVVSPATGAALPVVLGMGTGIPAGTGCALSQSITTAASLTTQLSHSLFPGIYCVGVYDIGHLTSDVNFSVRFKHP